jgi:hypothetical protein
MIEMKNLFFPDKTTSNNRTLSRLAVPPSMRLRAFSRP